MKQTRAVTRAIVSWTLPNKPHQTMKSEQTSTITELAMTSQYSSLNLDLGEEQDLLCQSVSQFAEKEIAPRAAAIDQENQFPNDLWRKFGDMALLGLTVSEEFGGSGMGYLAHVLAMEEISRASASVALSYGAHSNLCVNQIFRNG